LFIVSSKCFLHLLLICFLSPVMFTFFVFTQVCVKFYPSYILYYSVCMSWGFLPKFLFCCN
jgi:hypothetical protein